MVSEAYKQRAHNLVQKAKEKGLVKNYREFCKSDIAKRTALSEKEIAYYISKNEEERK